MKKIYYSVQTLFINDNVVDVMSSDLRWKYGEIPEKQDLTFSSFSDLYESIIGWQNVWRGITLFGKKRIVKSGTIKSITKKNFKSANWERSYEEIDTSIASLQALMERLSAEDFIEYCKDRDLVSCSMN